MRCWILYQSFRTPQDRTRYRVRVETSFFDRLLSDRIIQLWRALVMLRTDVKGNRTLYIICPVFFDPLQVIFIRLWIVFFVIFVVF